MRIILEYGQYKKQYITPINLFVKGLGKIELSTEQVGRKEDIIKDIIREIYPNVYRGGVINIDGFDVETEYLTKAQKNIAILYDIVNISRDTKTPIKDAESLIDFISNNRHDLFRPGGLYFDIIYSKLSGVSGIGKKNETIANVFFEKFAKSKGIDTSVYPVEDKKEDILGYDAYFEHGGKRYTIQTKTLSNLVDNGDTFLIYISGYYTQIKSNYLVLIPKDISMKKYIFRGKDIKNVNENGTECYSVPKDNFVYVD